jgi:hypothetical protein
VPVGRAGAHQALRAALTNGPRASERCFVHVRASTPGNVLAGRCFKSHAAGLTRVND